MLAKIAVIFVLLSITLGQLVCKDTRAGFHIVRGYQYPLVTVNTIFQDPLFKPFDDDSYQFEAITNVRNILNAGDDSNIAHLPWPNRRGNYFSLRYDGIVTPDTTGAFNITLGCDDGCRFFLEGKMIIDMWKSTALNLETRFSVVNLVAGTNYTWSLEMFETTINSAIQLNPNSLFATSRACIYQPVALPTTCNNAARALPREFWPSGAHAGSPTNVVIDNSVDIFNFNFPTLPPGGTGAADEWRLRWRGLFVAPVGGDVYFWANGDENVDVLINGRSVLNFGERRSPLYRIGGPLVNLIAGRAYNFEVVFIDTASTAATLELGITTGKSAAGSRRITNADLRDCIPYAVVAPESVVVNNFSPTPIPVRLSIVPSAPVNVSFSFPAGVLVSPCTLSFTPGNFDQVQYIYVTSTVNGAKINYVPTGAEYTGVDSTPTTLTFVLQNPGTLRRCNSYGDPHFLSFSGKNFDFFGQGYYYLYRSLDSSFIIQTLQLPCSKATCNFGVAVRYFDAVTIFYLNNNFPSIYENPQVSIVNNYTRTAINKGYRLSYPNGMTVEVIANFWTYRGIYYLDVLLISPQPFEGQGRGLCGTQDANQNNDYIDIDGKITTFENFTSAWLVPTQENIFLNNYAVIPQLTSGVIPPSPPTALTNCTNPPLPPPPPVPVCFPNCSPPPPPPVICPITQEEIEIFCYINFVNSSNAVACTNQGLNVTNLYYNCLFDAEVFCCLDCLGSLFDSLINNCPNPPNPCPSSCLGNGNCVGGKCVCPEGFFPPDCRPNYCPQTSVVSPSSGGPGTVVTLTGVNFDNGKVYTCHFAGNVNVTAIPISSTTAQCTVPNDGQGVVTTVDLVEDGKSCSPNPPTFTYTTGITECVAQDGFPATNISSTSKVVDCPPNEYGYRERVCNDRGKWEDINDECSPCPPTRVSNAGTELITGCQCPPGKIVDVTTNTCEEFYVVPGNNCSSIAGPGIIPVTLSRQPSTDVVVTINPGSGVTVSPCTLTFTPSNWNIPQLIFAQTASPDGKISYTASGPQYSLFTHPNSTVCLEPTTSTRKTCLSWGDPHIVSTDGKQYDVHGNGIAYYLYRSLDSSFVVQATHKQCGYNQFVSCNAAVIIRYLNAIVYFSVNGSSTTFYESPIAKATAGYSSQLNGVVRALIFPNGIRVRLADLYWSAGKSYYIDVAISLLDPQHRGKSLGLCGTFDGDNTNDFVGKSGEPLSMMDHINTWAVPASENLLDNFNAVIPPLGGTPIPAVVLTDCQAPLPPSGKDSTADPIINPPSGTCLLTQSFVEGFCAKAFLESAEAKTCQAQGVDTQVLYNNCIVDVSAMCDTTAAGPAYNALITQCPMPPPNLCDNNCNYNGQCDNGKCICNPGFEEPNCQPTQCALTTEINPTSGSPGDIINLSGSGFANAMTYECQFASQFGINNTPATIVSAAKATCQVPVDIVGTVTSVSLLKDGLACAFQSNIPFTYTGGISTCPPMNGFLETGLSTTQVLVDCPANQYGTRSRTCSSRAESSVSNNCLACPSTSTSPAGTQMASGCSCPTGYEFDSNLNCVDINECMNNNGGCDPVFGTCMNTIGSRTCGCVPGYILSGSVCNPDARTNEINVFGPIARFLLDGNILDSSGNNRTLTTQMPRQFNNFFMNNVPTNRALVMNRMGVVTSRLPLDTSITITVIFNIRTVTDLVDIVELCPTPTSSITQCPLTIQITSTGKILWKRFGNLILSGSRRFINPGRTYFLVISWRSNTLLTWLDDRQLGTFNYMFPSGNYHLRSGKDLVGTIDELVVYDQTTWSTNFMLHSNFIKCSNPCPSGKVCHTTATGNTCGNPVMVD